MRIILAVSLLVASASALAQPPPGEHAAAQNEPIVVTGVRVQDFRDRLVACLARNCPPNEDIDATMALAEAEFINGNLRDARRTVALSLDRNRRHSEAYPEPVADLYRASARVARHLGLDHEAQRSTYAILRTLREGLPNEDHRHFTARLEIVELMTTLGNADAALSQLEQLAEQARRAGRHDVAALAELRRLWLELARAPRGSARRQLTELAAATDPDRRILSTGARILLARLRRDEGDNAGADALIREVARGYVAPRTLVYAPPYELAVREINGTGSTSSTTSRISDNFEDKWIDVGFWVSPEGRVEGLEVLRRGARADWAAPLLDSIRARIYAPNPDNDTTYRLERYTYTAGFETQTGSRLRVRSPRARVEYLDLSQESPARLSARPEG